MVITIGAFVHIAQVVEPGFQKREAQNNGPDCRHLLKELEHFSGGFPLASPVHNTNGSLGVGAEANFSSE